MARERSNAVPGYDYLDTVTTGGTGFGIMALLAGRVARLLTARRRAASASGRSSLFSAAPKRYHGVFPHFLHGATGCGHSVLANRTMAATWWRPHS